MEDKNMKRYLTSKKKIMKREESVQEIKRLKRCNN